MKKVISLLGIIFFAFYSVSQNLIPNADWEDGPLDSSDPFTGWNSNGPPVGWTPIATPDRIVFDSPALSRDGHPPYSGEAYCVFYYDEGAKCELNSPLVAGQTYCISAWLDVDDNFDAGPGQISFEFQGDTIQTPFVNNTGDWQFFDATFTANTNSDSLYLFANGNNLMKLDFMILDTIGCNSAEPVGISSFNNSDFYMYPNPANDVLHFSKKMKSVEITTVLGQIVLVEHETQIVKITDLPRGIYLIKADDKTQRLLKE